MAALRASGTLARLAYDAVLVAMPPLAEVGQNVSLQSLNTLALPARAAQFARLEDVAALPALLAKYGRPKLVLGGGSNILLAGDVDGLVLRVVLAGVSCVGEDADWRYVEAGAGEAWDALVRSTLAQGWAGLENLICIPGTVGAAPVQNIGAYGVEVRERIAAVEAFDLHSGTLQWLDGAQCGFAYRDSRFKQEAGRWLICRVRLRLPKRWQPVLRYAELAQALAAGELPDARRIADEVAALRKRKLPDPAVLPNAGSFFKNPTVCAEERARLQARFPALRHFAQPDGSARIAAAWLIEQCGWKGRRLGAAGIHAEHALIVVNHGGATGADVLALEAAVRAAVQERFGLRLEREPVLAGGGGAAV